MTALRGGLLAAERLPAAAALRGREEGTLVRVVDQPDSGAGLAGLLPGGRFPFSRSDLLFGFFLNGLSQDGGLDDVKESRLAVPARPPGP